MNLTLKQWLELFEDGGCTEALRSKSAQIVEMIRSRTGNADRLLSIQSADDIKVIFYDRLCDVYIGCFTELLSLEMGEAEFAAEIVMSDSVTPRLRQAVQALSDRLKEDADMIYRRFPFLRDIEEKITANFIESEVLLLDRYALSKEEISEAIFGGRPSGRILSFLKQRIYSRQHGRFVQGINTEAGVIYYKPHDCQVDALWRDIIMLGFSDITRATDVVWGKGYGFCKEIKAEPLEDINDARLYFFRFGALTAVLSVLGSIDIHKNNIMACGAWPVLIDTENLITPEAGLSDSLCPQEADPAFPSGPMGRFARLLYLYREDGPADEGFTLFLLRVLGKARLKRKAGDLLPPLKAAYARALAAKKKIRTRTTAMIALEAARLLEGDLQWISL